LRDFRKNTGNLWMEAIFTTKVLTEDLQEMKIFRK